jgi:hypothetical protein
MGSTRSGSQPPQIHAGQRHHRAPQGSNLSTYHHASLHGGDREAGRSSSGRWPDMQNRSTQDAHSDPIGMPGLVIAGKLPTAPNGGYACGCVGGRLRSVITAAGRRFGSQPLGPLNATTKPQRLPQFPIRRVGAREPGPRHIAKVTPSLDGYPTGSRFINHARSSPAPSARSGSQGEVPMLGFIKPQRGQLHGPGAAGFAM